MVNQNLQLRHFLSFVMHFYIIPNLTYYLFDDLLETNLYFYQRNFSHQIIFNLLRVKYEPIQQFCLNTGVLRMSQTVFEEIIERQKNSFSWVLFNLVNIQRFFQCENILINCNRNDSIILNGYKVNLPENNFNILLDLGRTIPFTEGNAFLKRAEIVSIENIGFLNIQQRNIFILDFFSFPDS